MKTNLIIIAAAFAALSFAACNNGDKESTTTETTGTESTGADNSTASGNTSSFDESASYVDLKTSKTVNVKRDASTGYVTNRETNEPLLFYYNPVTNDTFDRSGRVVNNYLIRGTDGSYTLDEERWRTKVDEDGDFKAKDGDDAKIKIDGNEPEVKVKTDDAKVKADENNYKKKKDGKVVEKSNN